MSDDILRSRLFADKIRRREDKEQRRLIDDYSCDLSFDPIGELLISESAWKHVMSLGVEPKTVFAHPDILQAHPTTSLHYRGMALLSRKRVAQFATAVKDWEEGTRRAPVNFNLAKKVAILYNTLISSIIEGSTDWTLENGYRNIIATMGITLDGSFRSRIGNMAEEVVKDRIVVWLKAKGLIARDAPEIGHYSLPNDTLMNFGSEPDIDFVRNERSVATIEIKGGRDPAAALERLGAVSKSFNETPPGCINFLVVGVITNEMQNRLDAMGVVKVYKLDDISQKGKCWDDFINEVFHHAVRII